MIHPDIQKGKDSTNTLQLKKEIGGTAAGTNRIMKVTKVCGKCHQVTPFR